MIVLKDGESERPMANLLTALCSFSEIHTDFTYILIK
jgi:hypothetical protein